MIVHAARICVRPARRDDLPAIEQLVAGMFRDLGTADQPTVWNAELAQAFTERLGRDIAAYVTVDRADRPVAVAIGVVDHRLPSPRRLTGQIGYVEWLATHAQYRRKGAARLALRELLRWFDEHGIEAVDVHASEAAVPLYTDLGFAAPRATALRRPRLEAGTDMGGMIHSTARRAD